MIILIEFSANVQLTQNKIHEHKIKRTPLKSFSKDLNGLMQMPKKRSIQKLRLEYYEDENSWQ